MILTFVRHGATDWNGSKRFQGHSDLALNEEGRAQARDLAVRLANEPVDRVYSSDLKRAMETARTIAQPHGLQIVADARLREFAFGAWEGLTWAEIVAERPHLREGDWKTPHLFAPEGGETFDAVWGRMRSFYREIASEPLAHVIVVTHAGALHAMLDVLEARLESGVTIPVASITRVAIEGERARIIPP